MGRLQGLMARSPTLAHTLTGLRDTLDGLKVARRTTIGEEVLTVATDMLRGNSEGGGYQIEKR
jgi:hypothetical protein